MAIDSPRRAVIPFALVAIVLLGSIGPLGFHSYDGPLSSGARGVLPAPHNHPAATAPRSPTEIAPAYILTPGVSSQGPLSPSYPVSVVVGLAIPNPAALDGLVAALYAPGTPEFHGFRSTSELAKDFGPSSSDTSAALAYFHTFGLAVSLSPDHLLLTVSGPSARLAAAFGTTFEEYRDPGGRAFFSHPTPATLPAVAPWSGAFGLGNGTPLVPASLGPASAKTPLTPAAGCLGTAGAPLLPCQVWQAYEMTSLMSGGTNGTGFRLAVVDPYSSGEPQPNLMSDLATFASQTGVSVGSVNYVYPVPTSRNLNSSTNPGWSVEDALDLQWSRASAPGATIEMTLAPDPGPGLYAAVDWVVAHQAADVISMSWGEPDVGVYNAFNTPCSVACNASSDGSYGLLAPVLEFAAAEGISAFAASGDCGSADGTSGVATNFPASVPFVTGVGGTVLSVDVSGTYQGEVAWGGNASGAQSPGCVNQGGSGGGYSPFPRPGWQTGVHPGGAKRGVPDVALDAATAAHIVLSGSATGAAGTSLSTPIWAGIATIADQFSGGRLGLLNPTLYAIASGTNYSRDFHDVVSGTNGYSAGTGWDAVTGLGTPRVATLVVDLSARPSISTSSLAAFVYATPRFGLAPLTVTFHVNATGGTGSYPLEGVAFGDGNASFASGSIATYTYPFPGVYSAEAYLADSVANYSVSPPLAIVVGGGSAVAATLSASTNTPARGAPVVFSVGVVGGQAPYEYNFTFGDGTYLSGAGSASTSHTYGARGSFCAEVVVSDSGSPRNGGTSTRQAIEVGGSPLRDCRNDTTPLTMTPTGNSGVRDAPADFPSLFSVAGGSTAAGTLPPSVQFSSTDPYLSACACSIFRTPGNYSVTGYGNDSENEQASATTSVTVAPPLLVAFVATPTYGTAPLTVDFSATVSGGFGANVGTTQWSFGNGSGTVGAAATATYATPGRYVAVGHLSDLGHANASEAFLIDVVASAAAPVPTLTARIAPAVDVPFGTLVSFGAQMHAASGGLAASTFQWTVGAGSGAFEGSFSWAFSAAFPGAGNRTLDATLTAMDLATGAIVNATFDLADFAALEPSGFVPRVNALVLSDSGGPASGAAPLTWKGGATVAGPGVVTRLWTFGAGNSSNAGTVQHVYNAGRYTIVFRANDSFRDLAIDVHSVAVSGALGVTASVSPTGGAAPLTVTFRSNASGGLGPPYRFGWSFGDNSTGTLENGTHRFAGPGNYRVTLNVSDSDHDSVVRSWNLTVNSNSVSLLPLVSILVAAGIGAGTAIAVVLLRRRPRKATPSP